MANREKGKKVEAVTDFFLGSNFTVDSDCSHEIRRQLLLGRKAMTNLDSVLESRDITLPTKVHIIKAIVHGVAKRDELQAGIKIGGINFNNLKCERYHCNGRDEQE